MKQQLLRKFQYTIPSSAVTIAAGKENYFVAEHLPLLKVSINFEEGVLQLEGDWNFMMNANKHNDGKWFSYHRERVKVKMSINPATPVNLNDPFADGLIIPMEGSIKDEICFSACTGLLVIDHVSGKNDEYINQWDLSFYIYDNQFDGSEIRFKLPIQLSLYNENNN